MSVAEVRLFLTDGRPDFRPVDPSDGPSRTLVSLCGMTVGNRTHFPADRFKAALVRVADRSPWLRAEVVNGDCDGEDVGTVLVAFANSGGEVPQGVIRHGTAELRLEGTGGRSGRVRERPTPKQTPSVPTTDPLSELASPAQPPRSLVEHARLFALRLRDAPPDQQPPLAEEVAEAYVLLAEELCQLAGRDQKLATESEKRSIWAARVAVFRAAHPDIELSSRPTLSQTQAAKLLGITPQRVYQLAKDEVLDGEPPFSLIQLARFFMTPRPPHLHRDRRGSTDTKGEV
jgi:hypothetical protein